MGSRGHAGTPTSRPQRRGGTAPLRAVVQARCHIPAIPVRLVPRLQSVARSAPWRTAKRARQVARPINCPITGHRCLWQGADVFGSSATNRKQRLRLPGRPCGRATVGTPGLRSTSTSLCARIISKLARCRAAQGWPLSPEQERKGQLSSPDRAMISRPHDVIVCFEFH